MKIIAAILLALSFSASAESAYLYTEVSQPGETMDAFVVRIAPRAYNVTEKTNSEVCGNLKVNESGLIQIDIYTDRKPFSCSIEEGDHSFHTHTKLGGPRWSSADYKSPGYMSWGNRVFHQEGSPKTRLVGRF